MNLNHMNLPVPDIADTEVFFMKYFGMKTIFSLPNGALVIMRDEAGMVLNLSHFDQSAEIQYPKDFHVGFFVETREEVDAVYQRMAADGLETGVPRKLHGRWSFYVHSPGGFLTEVATLEGIEI